MRKAYSYTRFSTPEQRHGHSYERQKRLSEEWATTNGYQLVDHIDGFRLHDEGTSSFHGENKAEGGALGEFLRFARNGAIEKGSALVVESLDRLSREGAMEFLPDFLSLINKGITVVTLLGSGARVYEKGKVDDLDLIVSILELSRAHEESATKSFRSWKNHCAKRDAVRAGAEKGLHLIGDGVAPVWIRIKKDGGRGPWPCELIPERVEIIKKMIEWYFDGLGENLIIKKLNGLGIDTWSQGKRKAECWGRGRVHQLLRNRQLIGEHKMYYFPHKDEPGENKHRVTSRKIALRKQDGPPIPNFFPAAIDEATFNLLQKEIDRRRKGKGRTGNVVSMFPYIAKCGYCGGGMIYENKSQIYKYLICKNHKFGVGCIGTYTPYQLVEDAFLQWCREVDLGGLIGNIDHRLHLGNLEKELSEVSSQHEELYKESESRRRSLAILAGDMSEKDYLSTKHEFEVVAAERDRAEKRKKEIEAEITDLESSDRTVANHIESLRKLYKRLEKAEPGEERQALRVRLRGAIKAAVSRIDFYHDGLHDKAVDFTGAGVELIDCCEEELADLNLAKLKFSDNPAKVKAAQSKYSLAKQTYERLNTGRESGCFLVTLKNGSQRLFQLDELTKGYQERLAFESDTDRIVYGGTVIELNPEKLTEEQLRQEIADPQDWHY